MSQTVDARGLSCPQPVLIVMERMKEMGSGQIEVIVDNEVSRENVGRAARSKGWQVEDEKREGGDYHLLLRR
ncbi:MAG: sulfurtransferase TusA family protein [Syntrophobacteraceae bacterium]|jgi:TusA-related sulfurtransferase|nr:sulfurtransferase TusA family protein [Syntrophobacteraceae bacterium]